MKRLKIIYVDHLPSTPPEESSPEIVHVFIGTSRKKVELSILRNGFIVTDPALHEIERRIEQLEHAAPRRVRSVAESVGLYPNVSAEWRRFFDDLLQRENSWAFLVPVIQANSQN
jgi:predicted double-glycine peptidase